MKNSSRLPSEGEVVLRKFREGDESAFDYFFHKFYPLVTLFAHRIVRDRPLAEEVAQDVFFKVWAHRENFPSIASLKAFLYVAARNACFNWLSKNQTRERYQEAFAAMTEQNEESVLHDIIRSEVWAELSGAIATLPAQCRYIIRSIFEDEKKPREIAEELGVSVSTINNQKARGLQLLRKTLDKGRYDALIIAIAILTK